MIQEIFVNEIAKEVEIIQAEMKFVENEYDNYIRELQNTYKIAKVFNGMEKHRRPYPYDMEALKVKHKDRIEKGIRARF